ncbi:PQQ-dependent sugar dehydrogenase [Pyxidicoccus fallax]|uniref:PQQ-dependent sugar dehydrogenase n=1 Tax=Pyxidicoccus fallax TaxID=394095 RepID=A0A848L6C3_9BACT|nr:PQQ-dependent sugar dehydrogenase [Pyxidicoccus fallax]NMO14279.1 PQQ-dependent sugar dehydrogenase [Pyxidicoccus fallax]NPC79916.1 PQQ-dependent sugar dehydrogenase [Pyxidicoccus fallax]
MRTWMKTFGLAALLSGLGSAYGQSPRSPSEQNGNLAPGGAKGSQQTQPREDAAAQGAPLETAPPNVPEFKPAFPGQTRAPGVKSRTAIQVTEIASGFNKPWAIAFLPDRRMLVTEKPTGKLFIVTPDGKKSPAVEGLPPVDGRNQGGLLDVEVGPDYAKSGLIYWTYYEPREGGNGLAVARAKLVDGPKPRVANLQVIFRMQPTLESTLHAGGRLVFTPDGKLFVTLGERSILPGRVQARDLKSHFGKIVRINPDGSVPQDNPFVGRQDARPEIWSLGHRNILSAALDSQNRLWEVEMGPRGGDELNLVGKAKDYGWPTIGYGEEYSGEPIHKTTQGPGMEQPVYYWDPVISPSGMVIYSGTLFPEWRDNVFIGGLSSQALVRLVMKDDRVVGEERLLTDLNARIREVVQGPEGALYVLTDASNGRLLKLTPR